MLFKKSSVLEENRSEYKLATLNLSETKIQVLATKFNIGNDGLKVSELRKLDFKNDSLTKLIAICGKSQGRCPLKYSFSEVSRF